MSRLSFEEATAVVDATRSAGKDKQGRLRPGGKKRNRAAAVGGPPAQDPEAELIRTEALRVTRQLERESREPEPWDGRFHETKAEVMDGVATITGEVIVREVDHPPPPRDAQESFARLEQRGVEEVLALIAEGHSQRELCDRIGVRPAHLHSWLDGQQAQARVRAAKRAAAQAWLDRGLAAITSATSLTDLAKARELAAMCRKYAQVADPATFSDRVQVDAHIEQGDDPATIEAKLKLLLATIK